MEFEPGAFFNGFIGVLIGSGIVAIWLRASASKIRDLENRVSELDKQRITALEQAVKAMHAGGCNVGQKVLERIDNVLGWTKKMDAKLDRIGEETAKQSSQIVANKDFITNLNTSHQHHTHDREAHRG